MTTPFVSVLDEMRARWDRLAQEDAFGHSCSAPGTDREAFLASGRELVRAQVEPELPALVGERTADDLVAMELGCGAGRNLGALAGLFGEVHGVDVSPVMLDEARKLLDGLERVKLHLCDGMTLRCVRRFDFDFILAHDTLCHFPDRDLVTYVLRQVGYRLAPGGVFKFQLDADRFDTEAISSMLDRAALRLDTSAVTDGDLWVRARASG